MAAVHILRIEGWMTLAALYPRKLERRTEAAEGSIPPEDAVDEAFRRSRPGERRGGPQKNFDTQLIPNLQPLVDEPGDDAIV